MTVPHVLLLQQGPTTSDAGEIFLDELCRAYPAARLSRFALTEEPIHSLPQCWQGNTIAYAPLPPEHGILGFGPHVAKLTSAPALCYARTVTVPRLVAQAVQFGRHRGVELVWAALSSPTLIHLANRVASNLRVPLVVTVWDPPEHISESLSLDLLSRRTVLAAFGETLCSALRCSVISEEMRSHYRSKYGIDSIILRHGIRRALRRPAKKELNESGNYIVGFCGSLYAGQEMRALISALATVDWRLGGRRVILRVLSPAIYLPILECSGDVNQHIEYLGWRSQDEAIELMSQADITYLPYWFDKRYETSVRLCFPTKLTSYLAAGRPVLYHGPKESSVIRFFRRFPAGLGCHSLEPSCIVESLLRLIRDRDLYASAVEAGQKALDEELNARVFFEQFAALIGVKTSALLADAGDCAPA